MKHEPATWTARWIWDEGTPRAIPTGHEMRLFRRTFEATPGARLVVHVSADSRYQLYLNGERVSVGPCKGDQWRKHYETVDLTPRLRAGKNVLAARVLHFAPADPPQLEHIGLTAVWRTAVGGFLLQGQIESGETLDTDERWKVARDESVTFHTNKGAELVGETETVDGALLPHDWSYFECDESGWKPAVPFWKAMSPEREQNYEFFGPWSLTPRPIPPLRESEHRHFHLVRGEGPVQEAAGRLRRQMLDLDDHQESMTLPAGSSWRLELDAGELITGYPSLHMVGGKGSVIRLTYAEAYGEGEEGNAWVKKGIRDNPEGRGLYGQWDEYRPGGGAEEYSPFWFRTFRFLRLDIKVGDEPIEDISFRATNATSLAEVKSRFQCSEERYHPLWHISVRTVARCMHETYEDCPYYEQMQYAMDTRLEALYSSYLTADDSLMRKAIHDFHCSWHPSGLLQSRTPCAYPQIIPGFSLWWILMVQDHWRFFGDPSLPRRYRSTVDSVLDWFDRQLTQDGLVGGFYYWPYFDWVKGWQAGCPAPAPEKPSTVFSLLYSLALDAAADLAGPAGYPHRVSEYRERAAAVNDAINRLCWDARRNLYRQGPDVEGFDVHCQAFAIISGAAPEGKRQALATACMEDRSLDQMNWAMQFFLFRALKAARMYDRSFELYNSWFGLADLNVTTWPEDPVHGRSDCHGWGSVPIYEFCAEILGVQPAAPGFEEILVAPQPVPLEWAKGTVITPRGPVSVSWKRENGTLEVQARGPQGVPLRVVQA